MKKSTKKKILHIIANTVLCFLAFLSLLLSITSITVRNALSPKTMEKIVATIDVNSHDTTIDEWIYLYMQEHYEDYLISFKISPESIAMIMDETDFNTFITNKLIDYSKDLLSGTGEGTLSSDEFMDFVVANEKVISKATGRYYIEGELDEIRSYLETMDMFGDVSAASICQRIGIHIHTVNLMLSWPVLTVLLILFFICLIILFVLNHKKICCPLLVSSISFGIIGILYFVLRIVFGTLCEKVALRIGIGASLVANIVEPVNIILSVCSYSCLLFFLALLILYLWKKGIISHVLPSHS